MRVLLSNRVENLVAKGEIAQFISSFATMYSKVLLQRHKKSSIGGKGLMKDILLVQKHQKLSVSRKWKTFI